MYETTVICPRSRELDAFFLTQSSSASPLGTSALRVGKLPSAGVLEARISNNDNEHHSIAEKRGS
jgi:hypothetical protein